MLDQNPPAPQITLEQFQAICAKSLPLAEVFDFEVVDLQHGHAVGRMPFDDKHLRPGGTISGPSMMALADYVMYAVVLSMIGPVELAVTTSLNINFLRKPGQADLFADGRILKLGRQLAYGEVELRSAGQDDLVAHVTATYSIPPDRGNG